MSFPRLHKKLFTDNGAGEKIKHDIVPTEDQIPSQSGQSGKFLTTNGSATSWATVDELPSQSGQSGKFLTTDGSDASWSDIPSATASVSGIVTTTAQTFGGNKTFDGTVTIGSHVVQTYNSETESLDFSFV